MPNYRVCVTGAMPVTLERIEAADESAALALMREELHDWADQVELEAELMEVQHGQGTD